MRAGYGPVTVNVTSSNPAVGTLVTSPLVLNPCQGSVTTQFDPVSVGTTLLSVEPPAGFAMPTNFQQITATVTQPDLYIFDLTVGRNLQVTHSVGMLGVTPPIPVTFTVTSSNGGVVAISTDPNAAGGASVSFPNVASSPSPPFYVQGMSVGTATMVAQAPGFNDRTATITVLPSGFRWGFSGLTTTAGANNTNLPLYTAYLNNGSLIAGSCGSCTAQSIRGGIGPVTVNLNTSNPLVGVLTTNPLVFNVGQSSLVTQFDPLTAGTANITIETPEGFHTPANYQQINANVNP